MIISEIKNDVAFASIDEWGRISGMGRTSIYEAISRGDLIARKMGSKTLIDVRHGVTWLNSLPMAAIRIKGSEPNDIRA